MVYGQVVIGPPGSGKTTYCNGMSQFLKLIGRKVAVVNMDPGNDELPYECAVNIEDLVKLSDVMMEHSLGPNGGLVYCMDYIEKNIDWLQAKLEPLLKDHYILFDFPGQVELFFLHPNAKNVIMGLIKKLNLQLTAVHLVDAHLCSDPGKYISSLVLSLSTMLHLELPHVNVLSKIDLIERYGRLAFNLDFYTDVQDLSYLQYHLDQDLRSAKYRYHLVSTQLIHRLNGVQDIKKLKCKIEVEKESHASTRDKNAVLLAKANKWEGEVIDKEEKLAKAIHELNDNSRCFEMLGKARRKSRLK